MHRRFAAAALLSLGGAMFSTAALATSEPRAELSGFPALRGIEAQAMSQEELQQIAGLGGNTTVDPIDPSILAAFIARLNPAAVARLRAILTGTQIGGVTLSDLLVSSFIQRGIPVPPVLLPPNPGGLEGNGTEAQGLEPN